jgi:hypothetical protein
MGIAPGAKTLVRNVPRSTISVRIPNEDTSCAMASEMASRHKSARRLVARDITTLAFEGKLGRGIHAEGREDGKTQNAAYLHDSTTLPLTHLGQDGFANTECVPYICFELGLCIFLWDVFDGARKHERGIVDDGSNAPFKQCIGFSDSFSDLFLRLGDVQCNPFAIGLRFDLFDKFGGLGWISGRCNDIVPSGQDVPDQRQPNAIT